MGSLKKIGISGLAVVIWYSASAVLFPAQDRVFVKIFNTATDKVLDGTPQSGADDNSVRQSEWRGSLGQQWTLRTVPGTNGTFVLIVNRLTHKRLEPMLPCDHGEKCAVHQIADATGRQQEWEIRATPDGRRRRFINRRTGKLLYVLGNGPKDASGSERGAGPPQRWTYAIADIVGPSTDDPDGGLAARYVPIGSYARAGR